MDQWSVQERCEPLCKGRFPSSAAPIKGYDGGTLRLGVTERYQVQAKAAFLRRGDGRGDGTYRPVYRQLTLSQQQRPDGVKSPDWSIEVPPVDTGEVLILVVIVRQAEARPWPHPKEFLFTLERT